MVLSRYPVVEPKARGAINEKCLYQIEQTNFEKIWLNPSISLCLAAFNGHKETVDLLRKHGGKTGEELKPEGK